MRLRFWEKVLKLGVKNLICLIWDGKSYREIIKDVLKFEDKLRGYMDKNELAGLEQDGVEWYGMG